MTPGGNLSFQVVTNFAAKKIDAGTCLSEPSIWRARTEGCTFTRCACNAMKKWLLEAVHSLSLSNIRNHYFHRNRIPPIRSFLGSRIKPYMGLSILKTKSGSLIKVLICASRNNDLTSATFI